MDKAALVSLGIPRHNVYRVALYPDTFRKLHLFPPDKTYLVLR